MIKIKMTSTDIDKQVLLLQEYPEIARKHFIPAVKMSVNILKALIRPTIPSPGRYGSGKARSDFQGKTTGTTLEKIQGRVGFVDAWHMNIVEHGARSHWLKPGKTRRTVVGNLLWSPEALQKSLDKFGGTLKKWPVNIKGVGWRKMDIHPGFGARGFLQAGYEKGQPLVEEQLATANERVAKELTT